MAHLPVGFPSVSPSLARSGRFTMVHAVDATGISPREQSVLVTTVRIFTLLSGAGFQGWARRESHDRLLPHSEPNPRFHYLYRVTHPCSSCFFDRISHLLDESILISKEEPLDQRCSCTVRGHRGTQWIRWDCPDDSGDVHASRYCPTQLNQSSAGFECRRPSSLRDWRCLIYRRDMGSCCL